MRSIKTSARHMTNAATTFRDRIDPSYSGLVCYKLSTSRFATKEL